MQAVSSPSRQKSWQRVSQVVNLLDALNAKETELAKRLEELRQAHGLSQEAAAHKAGVSNRQWQRWEAGESEPRGASLSRISDGFDVAIGELLGDDAHNRTPLARIEDALEGQAQRLDALEASVSQLVALLSGEPEETASLSDRLVKTLEHALSQRAREVGRSTRAPHPARRAAG